MYVEQISPPAQALSPTWRSGLLRLGLVWLASIAVCAHEWAAMADQWWNISTYAHVLLIPFILGWQVWHRWPQAKRLEPLCWFPGMGLYMLAVLVWVLGRLAGVAEVAQAGAGAMLMAAVPLMLGARVTAAFLFPVCYMVFLIPFGDEIIPPLQTITAKLTIFLVQVSGIPARIDGVFIDTPVGLFEVAEACSGVKFLIAMVAFGTLAANVCFRSWPRRIAFMVTCVVVPVLANGVRAWGTVYIAQVKGVDFAGSFDHIVYGWFFFAAVIAAIIGISWPFYDRGITDPMIDGEAIAASRRLARWEATPMLARSAAIGTGLALVVALGWTSVALRLAAPMPRHIEPPLVAGWHRVGTPLLVEWTPRLGGADHHIQLRYADDAGRIVDMVYGLYASQGPGKKASGFGEGALPTGTSWQWQGPGPRALAARSERLLAQGHIARLAQTTWRTGDTTTGSAVALRLANLEDRLMLHRRVTMVMILSVERDTDVEGAQGDAAAAQTLQDFRHAMGPIGSVMDQIAQGS
jgi:exosortase A